MQTRTLAEYAAGLTYDDLPPDVRDRARDCVQDTVGIGIFGAGLLFVFSASMAQTHPLAIQNTANDVQLTGKVIWADLVTADAGAAGDFYRGLFNWEINQAGKHYFMASNNFAIRFT